MPIIALAGLGIIGEAIVALILLAALALIVYLVVRFGSNIPLVGNWLASKTSHFMVLAVNSMANNLHSAMWAIENVASGLHTAATYLFNQIYYPLLQVLYYAEWIQYSLIPRTLQAAYDYAYRVYGWSVDYANKVLSAAYDFTNKALSLAYQYALDRYYQAVDFTNRALSAAYDFTNKALSLAYNYALSLYYQLIDFANKVLSLAYAYAYTVYGWAASYADDLVKAALARMDLLYRSAIETAKALAAKAFADALKAIDAVATSAIAAVWPGLITDVDGLIREIPEELSDVRDALARVPRALPTSLLGVLSAIGVLNLPMLRFLRKCGIPTCRNLSGLSELLQDLFGAGTDAALLALMIEVARNPRAAAEDINSVVGPITRGSADAFRQLLGR